MSDLRDEDLILFYYGEAAHAERIQQQLENSTQLKQRYDDLCATLDLATSAPVPEPAEDYSARLWQRLEPRLSEPRLKERPLTLPERLAAWLRPMLLRPAFATALLVVLAFAAGRWLPSSPAPTAPGDQVAVDQGRERLLRRSVGKHLESSGRLLTELSNLPAAAVAEEAQRAQMLLTANRLYRSTAQDSGMSSVALLLEELERLLLDLAHASRETDHDDLESIQRRVVDSSLLFRVQILSSRLRESMKENTPPVTTGDSSGAEI